ncbi:hypothetical protein PR202_gb22413 [Eleusine coracana subsp. coracana]|uniref:Uncharacterized protein n=1 Tax=Eleusine coracana subsp. coracana TaxID=191504 RepID=A0AAV5FH79_ELECO|nr:hypothetical protein PR202_gb22413 [Eleusine coracana subsp. coracana]
MSYRAHVWIAASQRPAAAAAAISAVALLPPPPLPRLQVRRPESMVLPAACACRTGIDDGESEGLLADSLLRCCTPWPQEIGRMDNRLASARLQAAVGTCYVEQDVRASRRQTPTSCCG